LLLATTPHPIEQAGIPRCPLPQGERAQIATPLARIASIALLVLVSFASGAAAQSNNVGHGDALTAYAQANLAQRPRTRIRISPRCFYRLQPTPFPVPYDCEAPGPGFVRECTSWLKPEYRPSGPVIVPEMRCWWVRG
jgi:hypothetical protein